MKIYELSLHWKQGDDFAFHLENTKTSYDALHDWANDFQERKEICEKLALALKDQKVTFEADTHIIRIYPEDRRASKVLEALVKDGLISHCDNSDD